MDNILNYIDEEGMLTEAEVRIRIKHLIESYKYAKKENSPELSLYEESLNKLNKILANIKKNSN